jgi:hypothetical protein
VVRQDQDQVFRDLWEAMIWLFTRLLKLAEAERQLRLSSRLQPLPPQLALLVAVLERFLSMGNAEEMVGLEELCVFHRTLALTVTRIILSACERALVATE